MRVSGNFAAVAKHSFPSQHCPAAIHLTIHSRRDHTLVLNCDIYPMLYFQSIVNQCTSHLGSCHYHDTSPIYNWNKSIEAFNQGISEFAFNSYLVRGVYTFKFMDREIKDTSVGEEEDEETEAGKDSID